MDNCTAVMPCLAVTCHFWGAPVFEYTRRQFFFALLLLAPATALAQSNLPATLSSGGYVLVMRHAHAPAEPSAGEPIDPANTTGERQLDASGKAQAQAIGRQFKTLNIRIGTVYSSPTFRARQTAWLMGFAQPQARDELGDGGVGMAAHAINEADTAWLKAQASQVPAPGENVLLITHGPNIALAFGDGFKDIAEAEIAVFRPDGKGGFSLVGRIKPDQPAP
jgi:phosphohistidine phosphatase SixA